MQSNGGTRDSQQQTQLTVIFPLCSLGSLVRTLAGASWSTSQAIAILEDLGSLVPDPEMGKAG